MHTESHDRNGWIDEPTCQRKNSRIRAWALAAAVSWLVIGLVVAACLMAMGCQANTSVTGAKASASSTTHTFKFKTDLPPPPPPAPTLKVRIGPRPWPEPGAGHWTKDPAK